MRAATLAALELRLGDPATGLARPNFVPRDVRSSFGIITELDSRPPGSPLGVTG